MTKSGHEPHHYKYEPKKMKGIEDFYYLLVVAFVVLIALAIYSGTFTAPTTGTQNMTVIQSYTSVGSVGFLAEYPAKTYNLGSFKVGQDQTENVKSVMLIETSSSLIGQKGEAYTINTPAWYQELKKGAKISFTVNETNRYGNLIIKWNGKDVFKQAAFPGQFTVNIPADDVKTDNSLEISSDGPGLMFWATALYTVKDFSVDMVYGPKKIAPFDILPSELESFHKGEVTFYGFGEGNLSVKINGVEIYSKVPTESEKASFTLSTVPLVAGQNIVSLSSTRTVTLENAKLNIYLLTNEVVRTKAFTFTQAQYDKLKALGKGGRIDITVASILRGGNLRVKLNGNALSVPSTVTAGTNSVYFDSSQAQAGDNSIELSATGAFDISDVVVGIEG